MNEKELKALQDEIRNEQKKQTDLIEDMKKAGADQKADFDKKYADLEKNIQTLSQQADAIQLAMNDKKFGGEKSPFEDMKKALTDKSRISELKKRGGSIAFEIKAGSTMTAATNLSTGSLDNSVVIPFRELGVGKAPDRIPTLLDLIEVGQINSDLDTWVERSARTISAASVAEGSKYVQSDLTYINKSQKVERIGHFFKVQNIMLEDWDQLLSEIRTEGMTGLEREIERQVFAGTGTTPEMQGITDSGIAQAFSSTSLAGLVPDPNVFDTARAAIMQLKEAEYTGSAIFINPAQGAQMDLAKDSNGAYVLPPFITAGGAIVRGLPVYESNLVTAGYMLVGDFRKCKLSFKRGIEVAIFDQNEDDPLYDRKTIVVSCRAVNRIKTPDYYAFVYDAIDDIKAAIQKIVG